MEDITGLCSQLHTPYGFSEINVQKSLGWDTTLIKEMGLISPVQNQIKILSLVPHFLAMHTNS